MRGTVPESEFNKPSMGEQIYRGQLDEQYVEVWGDRGGIGLSDLIYNELMEKILGQGTPGEERPRGPIELTDRDISRVTRLKTSAPRQAPMKVEIQPSADGGPTRVLAPWDSRVLMQTRTEGRSTVLLEHDGGLRSALIFDGVPATLVPGTVVKKGAPVGILSPEIKNFFWNLSAKPSVKNASEPASIVQGAEESSL
jgi:flagellar protein FlgJ